jgi:AAA family ATP:ADP antiporter
MLAVALVLTNWVDRRESERAVEPATPAAQTESKIGGQGGFRLIFSSQYLLLIAVLVLLSNLVNTTGEFILGKVVKEHAVQLASAGAGITQEKYIGNFYADFFFWVNVVGAGLQLFLVSRIMKFVGIGRALFFLPIIALGGYTLLAFAPILSLVRIAKIAENSTDYSVQNTARHALFLQTSRAAKYQAQAAIESFFWRAGDGFSALLVFTGTQLVFTVSRFAMINALLVLLWLAIAIWIVRVRRKRPLAKQHAA